MSGSPLNRARAALQRRMAAWVRRRQGPDQPPLLLQRRRLYILPTRAGIGFAALVLMMLLAGLNYANSVALMLTFILAGLAVVTMHACHRNLLKLAVQELSANAAFAGGQAVVRLRLANDSDLARVGIEIDGAGMKAAACDLSARTVAVVELHLATPRRGPQPLKRLRLSTTYPLGLFRAWTWLHVPLTVTVYPRPEGSRPIPPAPDAQPVGTRPGDTQADEWAGLRPFRDGDSPRQVAWKAYARGAPLLVKEYVATGSARRQFEFTALKGLDTEQRLSQLARWILDAQSAGEHYGLALPALRLAAGQGAAHCHHCLQALALHGHRQGYGYGDEPQHGHGHEHEHEPP